MGTRVVSKISRKIASACSDFFCVDTYRELTTTRCANTGTISGFNLRTGKFVGTITDAEGQPLEIGRAHV